MSVAELPTTSPPARRQPLNRRWNRPPSLSPLHKYCLDQQAWVFLRSALIATAGDANAALVLADILRWFHPKDNAPGLGLALHEGLPWVNKSIATLALETGLSDSQVRRAVASLLKKGLLRRAGRLELLRPENGIGEQAGAGTKVFAGLVRIAGDAAGGLLLSYLHYWFSPGKDGRARVTQFHAGEWWLAKRYADLAQETGLPERRVRTIVESLKKAGLIETAVYRFAGVPMLHLRFIEKGFDRSWEEATEGWWEKQLEKRYARKTRL